jgi:hypothetical protein
MIYMCVQKIYVCVCVAGEVGQGLQRLLYMCDLFLFCTSVYTLCLNELIMHNPPLPAPAVNTLRPRLLLPSFIPSPHALGNTEGCAS